LLNFGIYLALLEQLVLGGLTGTLSVATPGIVGASLPSFAPWVLAAVCYIVAAIQLLGFIGVFKENLSLFKTYRWLNSLAVVAAFGVAAAFIGVSASRHNTATADCRTNFFKTSDGESASSPDDKSQTLCNIFSWVDIGIMGGLWIVLLIFQLYILLVTRFYGVAQIEDHKKYFSVYGVGGSGTDDILMTDRPAGGNTWDANPEPTLPNMYQQGMGNEYSHVRQESNSSSVMMNEPYEKPNQVYSNYPTEPISPPHGTGHYDQTGAGQYYDSYPANNSYPPMGQYHPQ